MKSIFIYLTGIVMLFAINSCREKTSREIESDYLSSYIKDLHLNNNTDWVVVLPGLGCHGCIQEGEQFMKDNITNRSILFVLTKIQSLKILENKIGVNLRQQPNIFTDRENKFDVHTDNSIYPCIIQLQNGEIKEHEFQSPQNSQAFYNLKERLQKK
jgi:hypothetical protein